MQWLTYLDKGHRLAWRAAQEEGVRTRFRLSQADTDRSAWAVDTAGSRFSGAGAIFAALACAAGWRWPLAAYRLLPVRLIADLGYEWVAVRRHHFPGVTPYCARPGRSCPQP